MLSPVPFISLSPSLPKYGRLTVNLLDDIEPDGGGEDGREGERAGALTLSGEDRDGWSSGHFLELISWLMYRTRMR